MDRWLEKNVVFICDPYRESVVTLTTCICSRTQLLGLFVALGILNRGWVASRCRLTILRCDDAALIVLVTRVNSKNT